MISRIASKQAKYALDRGFRCLALKILGNSFGDINAVLDQAQDAADTTTKLLTDTLKTAIPGVPFVKIGSITKVLKHIKIGKKYNITKTYELAPWGNRVNPKWPPGSTAWQRPHYHPKITDGSGKTIPGGSKKLHRPWQRGITGPGKWVRDGEKL